MRKFITILLAFALVTTSVMGVSANTSGLFGGISILPELTERPETDYVRRDEFASVVSALMGLTSIGPANTPFADVKEDNIYGSAIATVKDGNMMNGVNEYEFAPSSTITIRDAAVVFVRLLGYQIWADTKGGYPNGYSAVATSLKLFNKVSKPLDSMLTFGDLWLLTDRALETPVAESSFSMSGGTLTEEIRISKNSLTLLEKNLGYTRYKAYVEEVIGDTYSVRVTITESDDRLVAKYGAGKTLILKAAPTVNISAFDKAPVYIWVSEDDELMHITTVENCEIIYASVYSVNRDYGASSGYIPSQIEEMAFWDIDKDFKMADNVKFYKNDIREYNKIHLIDRYVRAVVEDGKISAVETWDFKEGGIVTETNYKSVIYNKGDSTAAISGLGEYDKEILILNGEMRDMKELKADTLIDYYISSDKKTLIILASERKHTDIFEGYTADEVQIGSAVLKTAQTVYTYSKDKGVYREGHVSEFVGSRVSAYVDALGKVRYITGVGEVTGDSFIGYVGGVKAEGVLDKSHEVLVTNLNDDTFPQRAYKISDRAVYTDNTGNESNAEALYAALGANSDTISAKNVFRFKLNGKDEIVRVTELSPYFGYTTDADGFVQKSFSGQYPQTGDPTDITINDKALFLPKNEKITVLYDKDGEAMFGTTNYSVLEEKYITGTNTMFFFGEYMSSEFDLILLTGDVANLSGKKKLGIVDSVRTGIDDEGDPVFIAEIDGQAYFVSDNDAGLLQKDMLVYYSQNVGEFAYYDVNILEALELSGGFSTWADLDTQSIVLERGNVEKIDSRRLFVRDESDVIDAFFFNESGCKYTSYDETTGKFDDGNVYDLQQGKDIIYITLGGKVSYIFYLN